MYMHTCNTYIFLMYVHMYVPTYVLTYIHRYVHMYSTAQMQLHTRAHVLACPHACANMCLVTSDGTLVSLTYCTCMLHKGLHICVWCLNGYIRTCVILASPTCSRQSLRRIVSQGAYSSDIISGYSE